MIDIAAWIEFVKFAPGYALALLAFVWKRADDVRFQTELKALSDSFRLLLEKTLVSIQVTNTALEGITQASKLGERLEAIEGAMVRLGTLEETEALERTPKRIARR